MPPSWVGAIRHSIRRTGSGMSKWVSAMSARVRSARSCIQSRKLSAPSIRRAGSLSMWATASAIVAPSPARVAEIASISVSMRCSSSQPHA